MLLPVASSHVRARSTGPGLGKLPAAVLMFALLTLLILASLPTALPLLAAAVLWPPAFMFAADDSMDPDPAADVVRPRTPGKAPGPGPIPECADGTPPGTALPAMLVMLVLLLPIELLCGRLPPADGCLCMGGVCPAVAVLLPLLPAAAACCDLTTLTVVIDVWCMPASGSRLS